MFTLIFWYLLNFQSIDFLSFIEKNGKIYSPDYYSSNCVQFMYKVLIGSDIKFTPQEKKDIHISEISMKDINDILLVNKNIDSRVDGVVNVLINKGLAKKVIFKDISPGDIIQYWIHLEKNGINKIVYGHCGIVKEIKDGEIFMYGSHPSTKGFGITKLEKNYSDKNVSYGIYRIAICRINNHQHITLP